MNKILFQEEQKYRPVRVRIVLPVVLAITLVSYAFGIEMRINSAHGAGETWQQNLELILSGIFTVLLVVVIMIILFKTRLITIIDMDGLHLRYPPIWRKRRSIPKNLIGKYEIRKYRARFEYGGHGYKYRGKLIRRRKYGIAFTAHGNTGVQLTLTDGSKVLIGTQREQAFLYALDKLMNGSSNTT